MYYRYSVNGSWQMFKKEIGLRIFFTDIIVYRFITGKVTQSLSTPMPFVLVFILKKSQYCIRFNIVKWNKTISSSWNYNVHYSKYLLLHVKKIKRINIGKSLPFQKLNQMRFVTLELSKNATVEYALYIPFHYYLKISAFC